MDDGLVNRLSAEKIDSHIDAGGCCHTGHFGGVSYDPADSFLSR